MVKENDNEREKSPVALREEAILKFWEENKIFEKSVKQRPESRKFVFYEGPPTANGKPGIHHILARSFKDIICRYKTMRGYWVERKAGWDTHGLPVELQVEKELKISSKPEIEKFGIEEFNKKCKASVWEYKDEWEKMTKRIAFWLDLEHPYITYSNEYIESVWWILSEIYKKGLLYEGHKVVPYCSRCGTGLSSHEVALGYKKVPDKSVYVKFKAKYRADKTGRGVGALIYNDKGEILLVNRNEKSRRITWALPGGKVEKNETFMDALEREVVEELGVTVESAKPFSAKPDIFEGRIYETVCYKVKVKGEPKVMVEGELDKLKWFSIDNLPEIDYPPSKDAINAYKKNKNTFHINVDNSRPLVSVYALVWTTTPWTLLGNVALAINENIEYAMIKAGNDFYILAKDRIKEVFGADGYEIISVVKGRDLFGLEYEQLFDFMKPDKPAFKVVSGNFVTTQDGSGIVHIAPAFGEDDMRVAKENDLPVLMTVNLQGKFIPEITPWAGKYVAREETNKEIISELKKRGVLFKTEEIEHDYPFCWRCGTKLIYYAKKSWFIKMTDEKIKRALIENNEKINWVPEYVKEGRFGEWLREVKDWALSRERYWGTPLPIWKCAKCRENRIIGSIAELEKLGGEKFDDLHRPYIDNITFKCDKCGGEMRRVTDVIDCWFDSGSMPFSQWHYPFENKELVDEGKKFPADYISEAIDQTRGWFYTLLAISTLLGKGAPYKNVITYGHVLDAKGQKMSKSKGNVVDPWEVADKYGIDVLRWYFYTVGGPGEPKRFDFKDLAEVQNKFFRTYWNSYLFFKTYGKEKKLLAKAKTFPPKADQPRAENLLDRWIISRLNETILEATKLLDDYDVIHSARLIGNFVDELSNWYIRRSRDRMRIEESAAVWTLSLVLSELTKLTAPFAPFISEEIYRDIKINDCPKSVHLSDWPKADKELIDKKLNEQMQLVRQIVTLGLAARAKAKIKVRQPLSVLEIQEIKEKISAQGGSAGGGKVKVKLLDLIKDELNIKKVLFISKIKEGTGWISETNGAITVALDTKITDELKEEGMARDIARHIQEMRKDLGLTKENLIEIYYESNEALGRLLKKWSKYIKTKTIAKKIHEYKEGENPPARLAEAMAKRAGGLEKEIEIEGNNFKLAIIKIK